MKIERENFRDREDKMNPDNDFNDFDDIKVPTGTKNKNVHKTINLAFRFVVLTFSVTFATGLFSMTIGYILYATGHLNRINPILIISVFFISNIAVCTALAFITSKKSFEHMNLIIAAVSQVGKGDFDINLSENNGTEDVKEISKNINQMAKELKNLEIMRNDFINNFSHEFKTPIVSIQGFTKRLLTKELSEQTKHEYLEIILEESTRLAELSNKTLYMSKLENIASAPEKTGFMLDEQLRQCVLLFEKNWTKKNININLEMPEIKYSGNEEMLKQVWLNLIGNAIKFTPANGEILIFACLNETHVTVSIADSGIGMSDETSSRIFDKFFQGDPSRSTEGNGLGLSIVKKIIDFHNGGISVKTSPGNGSTFTIILPL